MTTIEGSGWNRQIDITLVAYCYVINFFHTLMILEFLQNHQLIRLLSWQIEWWYNDKVVIARLIVQYWLIFSPFLIFYYYFKILNCKVWETRKILGILHSAPCDNNYVTVKSVKIVITNLNLSKAFGPDCTPVVVLKNCKPEHSCILAGIFNMCLKESCFPDC